MDRKNQMYSLVEEWKLSGMTKGEFTASKSITYHGFNYWLKKHKQERSIQEPVSFFSVAQNTIATPKKKDLSPNKMKVEVPNNLGQSTELSLKNKTFGLSKALQKTICIELPNGIKISVY